MEYNTSREIMAIPEYGRNIQKMVNYAVSVDDRETRLILAKHIVDVMANMNPQIKVTNDYEHRLWDHLYIISDFKLDVDGPFAKPEKKDVYSRPKRLPYSEDHIRFKHYGLNLEKMIKEAIKLDVGQEKEEMVKMIANYMKRSYLSWNRDSVNDELILAQLEELSGGKLKLNEGESLLAVSDILSPAKTVKRKKGGAQKNKNNNQYQNKARKNK
ncbi:MAG: DUF4290 domain-containing protein [Bacteroidales bacterium]|nr:DUF4290 domain-containing protein [Bacteroidales bacterium]